MLYRCCWLGVLEVTKVGEFGCEVPVGSAAILVDELFIGVGVSDYRS